MNKTAMMQLRDKLELEIKVLENNPDEYDKGQLLAKRSVIKEIDSQMMEIEKEQIWKAFSEGGTDARRGEYIYIDYYTQTFITPN